ncbi:MAG: helix-turn-helix transcriptional regulator [Bacteroidetes bacterium]|nr:helix-turn-helix transcriptional regulator [Bacteroidota bacterium]
MNKQQITAQELVILKLLQQGLSNEMISNKAGVSINTVKFHLKNIYRKLGVNNRVSALNKFNESLIK